MKTKLTSRISAAALAGALICLPVVGINAASAASASTSSGSDVAALSSGDLRQAVKSLQRGQRPADSVETNGSSVLVEIVHHLSASAARQLVTSVGGSVRGEVPGVVVEALVPFDQLAAVEHTDGVDVVRPPLNVSEPMAEPGSGAATDVTADALVVGEEVAKTNATAWQGANVTGAGIKVGIVDYFQESAWNAAQTAAEVPAPAGTFCRRLGTTCDIYVQGEADGRHGTAVAEVIHEMAPGAALYRATVFSAADLQAAVDYFLTQGVRIISRSLAAQYDGAGDGTGPLADVLDYAVDNGITWFNAATNFGGTTARPGSYWRGSWNDSDGDGWLEFQGTDELMAFPCGWVGGLRWSDWAAGGRTDYDAYVFDDAAATTLKSDGGANGNRQTTGALPLESPNLSCSANDTDYLAVRLFDPGTSTAGDTLEFTALGALEHWQNPYSAAQPLADTSSPGGLAIGAIDPPNGSTIAPYSSQGPTNDNRIKPDLSAASCVASYTYSPGCFNGTSAATPVVAGAAALVLESGVATTPATLKTYLLDNATTDRGVAGSDNVFGRGELVLPAPPVCAGSDTPEPNDSVAGASVAVSGVAIASKVCSGNDDYFAIEGVAGQSVGALVQFTHALGDLDVQLFDPSGAVVATSQGTVDNESINFTATLTGLYTVWIYGYQDAANSYTVTLTSVVCPPDDAQEPNDSFASPSAIASGVAVRGITCPADDDYYSFPVQSGDAIDVALAFFHRFGDVDVQLLDGAGTVVASSQGTVDNEAIHYVAATAGSYRVRVYGFSSALNTYRLTVTTVAGAPGAPSAVAGTAGNGQVGLSWTAPANTGGSPISNYQVTVFNSAGGAATGVTGTTTRLTGSTATSFTFTGLTNGTAYTFKVAALNTAGTGPQSVLSSAVTPRTVPGAPSAVAGTAGNGQVGLSWTAPANTGGSPISNYQVTVFNSAGGAATGVTGTTTRLTGSTATSFTFTGLTNGTAYTFKVAALNAAGTGPQSALSSAVTPVASTSAAIVGLVDGGGNAYVRQGLTGAWTLVASGASALSVATDPVHGPLIGVITSTGTWVKQGTLTGPLTKVSGPGASAISVATDATNGPLIGMITADGAWVKRGSLTTAFTKVAAAGATAISVATDASHGPVIGIINATGFWAKQGSLTSAWTHESGAGALVISVATDATTGPVLGLITSAGAWAKQGALTGSFTKLASGASTISVATDATHGPLVGIITATGFWAKQGSLTSAWTHETGAGTTKISVGSNSSSGPVLGLIDGTGSWAKQGALTGSFTKLSGAGATAITTAS